MNDIISSKEKGDRAKVFNDGFYIEHIRSASEAVKLIATSQNGWAIQYIKNPSEAIQLNATSQSGYAIKYIVSPSENVKLNATSAHSGAIMYIADPSEAVQLKAVKNNGRALILIDDPTLAVVVEAIKTSPRIVFDDDLTGKITPSILNEIQQGLAVQIELIKSLFEDDYERVAMLNLTLPMLTARSINLIDSMDLPTDLALMCESPE
jgi:hypothetical protein